MVQEYLKEILFSNCEHKSHVSAEVAYTRVPALHCNIFHCAIHEVLPLEFIHWVTEHNEIMLYVSGVQTLLLFCYLALLYSHYV